MQRRDVIWSVVSIGFLISGVSALWSARKEPRGDPGRRRALFSGAMFLVAAGLALVSATL